jgi:hypothetical protein
MSVIKKQTRAAAQHIRLYRWFTECPAWRACDPVERALYLEIAGGYNGVNNGNITFSHRQAQERLGVSNKPIMRAFKGLQEKGFIVAARKGAFGWKVNRDGKKDRDRATTWTLTAEQIDWPARSLYLPTKDFMKWQPPKKSRYASGTSMVRPGHTIDDDIIRPQHTNGVPTAYDEGSKSPLDGTPQAHTYSIPLQGAAEGEARPLGAVLTTIVASAAHKQPAHQGKAARRAG